ncbi:MAG: single-stranded DNA-binding protein [Actinomycetota bacterium]|nr:single-stranded DNA-binding protein [Actinomycetota bacterium]
MDLNLVVLAGRLTAPPESRTLDSGSHFIRYLVSVRSELPQRRLDVVPVILRHPPEDVAGAEPGPGQRIWVAGSVQRRFWHAPEGRRSRLEVVAEQVCLREEPPAADHAVSQGRDGGAVVLGQ